MFVAEKVLLLLVISLTGYLRGNLTNIYVLESISSRI